MSQKMKDIEFRAWQFSPDTWLIKGVGCDSYLLIGKEKAMMIDTGMSRNNLRKFVETITSLPVIVVNSHGHFDHTGGNGYFDDVFMSAYASTEAKHVFETGEEKHSKSEYPLDYKIQIIEEGHVFDLGGRSIEAIAIGCHSPGSLAYLDRDKKLLFTGDEIDAGQVLVMGYDRGPSAHTVELHLENMKKLKTRQSEFYFICPAHNGSPLVSSYIDLFIQLDEKIIAGEEGKTDVFSATWQGHGHPQDPNWRRMESPGTTAVVYDQRDYPPI